MPTSVLKIPPVILTVRTESNEDWRDSIAWFDGDGNPIPLLGIYFRCQVRASAPETRVWIEADTVANAPAGAPANGLLVIDANRLGFAVPMLTMSKLPPSAYQFDVVAVADGVKRTVVRISTLEHALGVTRQ